MPEVKLWQVQSAMEKPARTRGVDHKSSLHPASLPVSFAFEQEPVTRGSKRIEPVSVDVFDSELLGPPNEEMIKVRPIPVRVRDLIMWTGGDEQLSFTRRVERLVENVMIKRKAAFQAAADFRVLALPASPFAQRQRRGQIVAAR